jgi:ribonuclease P protein component
VTVAAIPEGPGTAGSGGKTGHGLSRDQRLTQSSSFLQTYEAGLCRRGRLMTLWIRKQPDAALKLGVVASRRVGGAVQRNRAKRLLREAWRLNRHHFAGGVDVILSARSDIVKVALADVVSELMYLGSKTGLLDRKETP